MRKQNSLFSQVCNFINSLPIGTIFTNEQLYSKCDEHMTRWKGEDPYVTRQYRRHLVIANVLRHDSRGKWQVLAHIPDFVTVSSLEANRGVKKHIRGSWQLVGKPWNANMENPKTEDIRPTDSQSVSTITIYKLVDKHVEPAEVLKTQVSALLSTGSYFEDELDAWYFLSVGTGYAVEDLKAKWTAEQNVAHVLVEETKSNLEREEDDLIERLSGLVLIIGASSQMPKLIYKFVHGKLYGVKVFNAFKCDNDNIENESLKRLLQLHAGSSLPWTSLAEDILEEIECDTYYKEKEEFSAPIKEHSNKFITVEDIRGKDVYIINYGGLIVKGRIESFAIDCQSGTTPTIYDIEVLIDGQGVDTFDNLDGLLFSKEEAISALTKLVNSL